MQQLYMTADKFCLDGKPETIVPYGNGHISRTYLVTTVSDRKYILQRIADIFEPEGLMRNISLVTQYLARYAEDSRSYMHIVPTKDGKTWLADPAGNYRVYEFVEDAFCLEEPRSPEDFYQSGLAFGRFMNILRDFPAEQLTETLVNFHHTPDRYRIFREILEQDPLGRAERVKPEIDFILSREKKAGILQEMKGSGKLPTRVTHNDTKLNNVMFDNNTGKALCLIDLDTVMPGLAAWDFGDAVRFGAVTAAEDETDLSRMKLDLVMYRAFAGGYLQDSELKAEEIRSLPWGGWTMTLENGLRFLTDYLDGDHYFHIDRESHNLDRCRTQLKIVSEMEEHFDDLQRIVEEEAQH